MWSFPTQSALRSIGASTLFPIPSPNRRRSVQSRSPSPPRLDGEALLRQRNSLLLFSCCMFLAIFIWRVWWAPVVEAPVSRAYPEHGLSPYPTSSAPGAAAPAAPAPPPPLPPWPPTRPDAASPLSPFLLPVTLGGSADAWAASPAALPLSAARGVALLFHGCGHSAGVWATGGQPERALVAALLGAGLLPVALTSADSRAGGRSGCWDPSPSGADAPAVAAALAELARHWSAAKAAGAGAGGGGQAALHTHLVAIGASSGSAFASALALRVPLQGLALYIMPLLPPVLPALKEGGGGALTAAAVAESSSSSSSSSTLPPATAYPATLLFVHMPLDAITAGRVGKDVAELAGPKGYSSSSSGGVLLNLLVPPQPLWQRNVSAFFHTASSSGGSSGGGGGSSLLSQAAAGALWQALLSTGVLVAEAGAEAAAAVRAAGEGGGWWCASAAACSSAGAGAGAGGAADKGWWLGVGARSQEARDVIEGFLSDDRLAWRQVGGSGSGSGAGSSSSGGGGALAPFPCLWDWRGSSGDFAESAAPCEAGAAAAASASALRAEAVRVLRRGLGEMLNQAEGGHEMTDGHAATVAAALAKAVQG